MNTQIDVVIPTHGRPDFLAEAIASAATQDLPPQSITVVCDDEGVGVAEVVDEAARAFPIDMRLIRRDGAPGASLSRNVGADQGSSALIAFLDDDDLWAQDHLSRSAALLEDRTHDLVVSAIARFSGDEVLRLSIPVAELTHRDIFIEGTAVTGSSIVCRRERFVSIGGFDPDMRVSNDRDFFLRALRDGAPYAVNPEPTVRLRVHSMGRLTSPSHQRADGQRAFMLKHQRHYSWWDSRGLRYLSARTHVSASTSVLGKAWWMLRSAVFWSPSAERQVPLLRRLKN